ncbi:hypothetical protein XENOCAPTIV_013991, partial [Xenoophorus captivus]
VVTTISKLTKTCVLRLTLDNLFFILSGKVTNGGVSMWCELLQVRCSSHIMAFCLEHLRLNQNSGANFFHEYQMEGVSSEFNEICLEVSPENLSRALKTVQCAKSVKIKLTKKHCACLTIAAELVSIYLPPLKTMKNVVDRMKNLSNFLVVEANLNGEMNLKIETDLVSATTHFKDLGNPPWGKNICKHLSDGGPSQSRDPELMAEATVDIRKLQQFLVGQQVNPSKAMCSKSCSNTL